jgi:mycothiol synthase
MPKSETKKTDGNWPAGWSVRAPRRDDVDRVVELLNARSQKLYGENQSTRESVESWWGKQGLDLERDLLLALDARGAVSGLAFVADEGEPHASRGCSASVRPRYEENTQLWDALLAWALRRAMELVPCAPNEIRVAATAQAAAEDVVRRAALKRAGFKTVRIENHMRIDLAAPAAEAQWPTGISVRAADLEADLPAIVALYRESWRDHWGFVERPHADVLATFVSEIESRCGPIDPSLWFLAIEGDEVIGMSLGIPGLMDDPTGGYIYQLGVRPAWRKRGVALALLHHTFAEFGRRGFVAVELDVDSQSLTGAMRVYERAGMRGVRQSIDYEKELRPGIDLATRALAASRDPSSEGD